MQTWWISSSVERWIQATRSSSQTRRPPTLPDESASWGRGASTRLISPIVLLSVFVIVSNLIAYPLQSYIANFTHYLLQDPLRRSQMTTRNIENKMFLLLNAINSKVTSCTSSVFKLQLQSCTVSLLKGAGCPF